MKIDGLNIYNKYDGYDNNKLKGELNKNKSLNSTEKLSTNGSNEIKSNYMNGVNPDKLITKQERQYFKKMFPESSELIEKHVLFNRNAKVQSPAIMKGQLVDGVV